MKIWYFINGRNIRLAVRRPIRYGSTASGNRVILIQFGHNNVYALYRDGECIFTSFDWFNAQINYLETITA